MLYASGLTKYYGDNCALQALDLEVAAGQIYCLLGANGAGKTTTINLFLGFIQPSKGELYVDGVSPVLESVTARTRLAYIAEQVSLYPVLTGRENLDYFTRLSGRALNRTESDELFQCARLNLSDADRRVSEYSKGMRQKVGIAIALAKNAKALLLDEPLSGLDPHAASEFCSQLKILSGKGIAILMATHDIFRARELGGRIGIMKHGCLVDERDASNITAVQLEQAYLAHMRS